MAALLVLFGAETLQNATANGDTRTISFHHIHLKEDTTITYKVNGRYDQEAMKKVNWALRDWRTQEPTTMDPHLIDALWEVHREVGSSGHIHVIGGYRTPATNAMLRSRSSGVAKSSQHMRGKAIDFFIPDVKLEAVREAGLRLQRGGVGFYPSSGAPFVHMDTGSVRHWPRMPEAQLARVLARGPLTQVASNTRAPAARNSNPLVDFFVGNKVADEGAETVATVSARIAASKRAPEAPAAPVVVAANVPLPMARPARAPAATAPVVTAAVAAPAPASSGFEMASATSQIVRSAPAPRPSQAASLVAQSSPSVVSASDVINERGYWQGLVEESNPQPVTVAAARTDEPPRPPAYVPEVGGSVATGSIAPWPMSERRPGGETLAYAPANERISVATGPAGKARVVSRIPTAPERDTVAVKSVVAKPVPTAQAPAARAAAAKATDRLNDPWMRAMILAPNAQEFMSTSLYGAADFQTFGGYMQKPATSVLMTFSDDPHLGMSSDQFRGNAVVFVATVTFSQRTAALR